MPNPSRWYAGIQGRDPVIIGAVPGLIMSRCTSKQCHQGRTQNAQPPVLVERFCYGTGGIIRLKFETGQPCRIRSIIARNQRALSEHSPDSAQISTVLEIGQSCRDSPPSSPLFSMQIMSVPFFSRSSLRIYRKSSGSQVVTTPKFKA